jgi:phospholipid/cholesterol/gamma-HCH transport system substrate-binding protein
VIGRVLGFTIDLKNDRVTMKLEIEGEYTVPKDSAIEVKSKNIYGEMTADVQPGTSSEPLKSGDVLPGHLKRDLFGPEMVDKVNDVMARVQKLLADETLENVQGTSTELRALLKQLNGIASEQKVQIAALEKDLRASIASFDKTINSPELQAAVKRSNELSAHLSEATASLEQSSKSLQKLMAQIESGEGSAGKLLKDNQELYKNLNDSIANANKLLADVREHPRRYVKLSIF